MRGSFAESQNGKMRGTTPSDSDDEAEKDLRPRLKFEDNLHQRHVLDGLNNMRRNKHFCDVVLQVGKQEYFAHRVVLAAMSPYLMELFNSEQPTRKELEGAMVYELNGGFNKSALQVLIEFGYTARLDIPGDEVKSVYVAAMRLKMDRVARECINFMTDERNLDLDTCLELRALPGVGRMKDLVVQVDEFIDKNLKALIKTQRLLSLDRICVEVLHSSKEEHDLAQPEPISRMVLDWIHDLWLEDDKLTLSHLKEKKHLLYMAKDNTLQDCEEIEEGSANDSEIIQDYKKNNKLPKNQGKKVKRHSQVKPTKPYEIMFSRHINQDERKSEDHVDDWRVISCTDLDGTILALITIDGNLFCCSIIRRINRPKSPPKQIPLTMLPSNNGATFRGTNKPAPRVPSRPASKEKELFTPVEPMSKAKCVKLGSIHDELVVCGGFDRSQCLDTVSKYNPSSNTWMDLKPMSIPRARFDVAVKDGFLFVAGGSSGQMETSKSEKYDFARNCWVPIASLPDPVSNIGLCNLNGHIYCIGGSFGQAGNKHCFRLSEDATKWERIASLNTGRSQAGVTSFQGKIWVVGGCDAWNPLCTVEVYDPESNTWKAGPPMSTCRRGCGLVANGDLLYVIGGSDGTQSLCTTEVFDPRINLWTPGPNMTLCRNNVSAALVKDVIWVAGGFSGKAFLNSLEYLDPAREEWTTFIQTRKDGDVDQIGQELEKTDLKTGDETANDTGGANGATNEEEAMERKCTLPRCGD